MKFKLDEKWVVIDVNKRNIIDAVKQALKQKIPSGQKNDEHPFSEIDSTIERPRNKIHAKIAGLFESATGEWGAKEYYFSPVDRDLDYPSWILCDEYRNCLYEKLREQGRGSQDTESESIKSRYALICEILLRFAVIALSREENSKRNSEHLIDAMEEFCNILKKKGYLNSDWFKPFGEFSKFLATKNEYWLKSLRDASTVIRSIHSNKRAISNTLDYLINIKYQIMRQIVAYLGPMRGITAEDLSDNWIGSTFLKREAQVFGEGEPDNDTELANWSSLTYRQQTIAELSPQPARISELYRLLNDTNLLLSISIQIDMLMNETGWVLILMGAFKPSALSEMIAEHHKKCTELLNLIESDPIFNQSIAQGLIKYQAASVYHLDVIAQESCNNLTQLENPVVVKRMTSLINGSLNDLLGLQDRLECRFIDKKKLVNIAPKLLPSQELEEVDESGQNKQIVRKLFSH